MEQPLENERAAQKIIEHLTDAMFHLKNSKTIPDAVKRLVAQHLEEAEQEINQAVRP